MSENQNDKNPSTNTSPAKTDPVAKAPATSSKADTAKKPAPKKAKKEKAGGGFAKLLALLALIIAAGASGYGWFELQKIKQQLGEQATAVENFAGSSAMTKLKEGIYHRIDGFNKDQQSMQRQLTGLEEAVSMAVVEKNRDQRGWVLAEAEYLMSMANSRLRLLRDVKSATEALKGADMRIASLADPSLLPVQEALAEEISDLQAIGVMDANRIAMKLMYISKLVRKMPPAQVILGSEGSASDDDINPAIASLLSKIGIQKNQRPFDARPQQIDIMSMDQKLLMDLDAARHAVLRFDEKTYTSHINSARETIQQHYDMENEQVSIVDGELRDMNARKIFPTLPDISGSSIALNKARALYEPAKANKE